MMGIFMTILGTHLLHNGDCVQSGTHSHTIQVCLSAVGLAANHHAAHQAHAGDAALLPFKARAGEVRDALVKIPQ